MLERLLIAITIVALGIVAYRAYGWIVLRVRERRGLGLEPYQSGRPAILYFTDPGCAPCVNVQDPALAEVQGLLGDRLQVIKIQALEQVELTDAWGVLSLPTTFIIDSNGRPRGVNHGVARAARLLDQLAATGERIPEGTIESFGSSMPNR
jgi:thiol-disulfide isomerase/thioredoxin